MTEGPEQNALFDIEGPDEDGCVWICSAAGRTDWCHNLGPRDKVAEALSQWLGEIDYETNGSTNEEASADMSVTVLSEEIERLSGERDHLRVKLNLAEHQFPHDPQKIERLTRSISELDGMIAAKLMESRRLASASRRKD